MRFPIPATAGGVAVAALGAAGLVRAAVPVADASPKITSDAPPIVVTGAFVRPPLPPGHTAAAYFTVRNTTASPDVLQSVITGAGSGAVIHADGAMQATGLHDVQQATGLTVPAHSAVTLAPGKGHVMITGVYGRLAAGQSVNLELQFRDAGPVQATAVVRPYGTSTPSGAHS